MIFFSLCLVFLSSLSPLFLLLPLFFPPSLHITYIKSYFKKSFLKKDFNKRNVNKKVMKDESDQNALYEEENGRKKKTEVGSYLGRKKPER